MATTCIDLLTHNEGMQHQQPRRDSTSSSSSCMIVCSKCKGPLRSDITGLKRCGHLFHARCASSIHDRCPKCNKPVKDVETDYLSFYITFGQPDSTADIASSQDEEGELRQRALEAYARRKQVKSDKQSLVAKLRGLEQKNAQLQDELTRTVTECSRIEKEHARDEAKLADTARTISKSIERTTGAAKLIENLECQRIVQEAWKQTSEAFVETPKDEVLAMAKAHAAMKELLQSIRNAAMANDKAKVERIIGFVLSAVDDRRIESAKLHRKIKEKEHQIQCKKEQLQQLWSRNARKGHKSQTKMDVEAGGRRNRKGKKSLNPNMHGGDLARVKKQKIVDLDGDGLETMLSLYGQRNRRRSDDDDCLDCAHVGKIFY